MLGLEKLFTKTDTRRIPVAESVALAEMRNEMQQMDRRHNADMQALGRVREYSSYPAVAFDGEKSLGGIGPAYNYMPDYDTLRARSWQAYLDSEIAQTIIHKYILWIIGEGLRLEAEPKKKVLELEKFTDFDKDEAFESTAEERYNLYSSSTMSSLSDMVTLDELACEALKNAIVGGDCLAVQRYIDGQVKVELIDGVHVANPIGMVSLGLEYMPLENYYRLPNGNRVSHGVELDNKGRHIGYYVRTALMEYEYIKARDESNGHLRAFLVYGLKYRIDNVRGIPLISAVMEKLKKMERYEDATLGSAEERAKVPFFFEHELGASGINPMGDRLAVATGISKNLPKDINGQDMANKVAASIDKQVFSLPPGATIKAIESDVATEFQPFFTMNINIVCATLSIPPDVAMSMYNSNYSASRAAIKDWERIVMVKRFQFSRQFYQPNYNMWLDIQVLSFKIVANGYLKAKAAGNIMALEAYRSARFIGAQVPHIDPKKEIDAVRAKLGPLGAMLPLISPEDAAEISNGGEITNNIAKLLKLFEYAKDKGLDLNPPKIEPGTDNNNDSNGEDTEEEKKIKPA